MAGEERAHVAVGPDAEQDDIDMRRGAGTANDPLLVLGGGSGEVGNLGAHAVDSSWVQLDPREEQLVGNVVIRIGIIRRDGTLVAPEQIDVAPAHPCERQRWTERRGRRSTRQRQRQTAELLEAPLDPRHEGLRQILNLAVHHIAPCAHASILSEGLRPSDSPTRVLARRFRLRAKRFGETSP